MLTEKTHYYKTFFEKIWQFEQNEVFVKFWKSAFLWHSHSTDHESERLICDVKRQLFRNWKQDFMHAYPFLRVTSVVACDNFNPSLLECFTFLWEGRRLRWMKCQNSGRFELFKGILKKHVVFKSQNFFVTCTLNWKKSKTF